MSCFTAGLTGNWKGASILSNGRKGKNKKIVRKKKDEQLEAGKNRKIKVQKQEGPKAVGHEAEERQMNAE